MGGADAFALVLIIILTVMLYDRLKSSGTICRPKKGMLKDLTYLDDQVEPYSDDHATFESAVKARIAATPSPPKREGYLNHLNYNDIVEREVNVTYDPNDPGVYYHQNELMLHGGAAEYAERLMEDDVDDEIKKNHKESLKDRKSYTNTAIRLYDDLEEDSRPRNHGLSLRRCTEIPQRGIISQLPDIKHGHESSIGYCFDIASPSSHPKPCKPCKQ